MEESLMVRNTDGGRIDAKTCGSQALGIGSRAGLLRRLAAASRFRAHRRHEVQLAGGTG